MKCAERKGFAIGELSWVELEATSVEVSVRTGEATRHLSSFLLHFLAPLFTLAVHFSLFIAASSGHTRIAVSAGIPPEFLARRAGARDASSLPRFLRYLSVSVPIFAQYLTSFLKRQLKQVVTRCGPKIENRGLMSR